MTTSFIQQAFGAAVRWALFWAQATEHWTLSFHSEVSSGEGVAFDRWQTGVIVGVFADLGMGGELGSI